jgi:hypothetical protein
MLYGALDDLAGEGLIQEVRKEDLPADQVRWRFYDLTPQGQRAVEDETARLEAVLNRARTALGTAPGVGG